MTAKKTGRGRPLKAARDRRSNVVKIRLMDSLKQALEVVAKEERQSLSAAIEATLERYFQQEHYYGDSYPARLYGRMIAGAFSMAGRTAELNRSFEEGGDRVADWTRDPYCYEQAATAVIRALAEYRPPGAVKHPTKRPIQERNSENILSKLHEYFSTRGPKEESPPAATGLRVEEVAAKVGAYTNLEERARRLRVDAAALAKEIEEHRRMSAKDIEALDDLFAEMRNAVGDTIDPAVLFVDDRTVFAMTVDGDSMVEADLRDGDTVYIERTDDPKDGDVVVALINRSNEAFLRYYRDVDDGIELAPAHPMYEPHVFHPSEIQIYGRVVGKKLRDMPMKTPIKTVSIGNPVSGFNFLPKPSKG